MKNINIGNKYWVQLLFFLFMVPVVEGKPFRGGELRTYESYRYGRFEVSMRSAPGSGVLSSFFTYRDFWSEGLTGSENWNEIDWEYLGVHGDKAQTNYITQGEWNHEQLVTVGFNPHEDFHVYAFEWTPEYLAFFIDNDLVRYEDGYHIDSLYHYQKIMMNIWQPTYVEWVGEFDEDILPVYAFYDWVKYYAYVPGTGNTGTDNDFIQLWEDDFDDWDTDRWEKATHTFDNNNVDFIEENVVFHDGYMILCMTTPGNTGYGNEDPEHVLLNPGFESGFTNWSVWPENLTNYSVMTEPVLHGDHSLKLFGQNTGTTNSIAVYQTFNPSQGEEFTFSGSVYSASDDPIAGDNTAFLEMTFFDGNWSVLGDQPVSSSITSSSPTDQWLPLTISGTAPNGVVSFNVAMIFKQMNSAGGSVYFDDLGLFYPELSTNIDIPRVNHTTLQVYPNPFNKRTIIQIKAQDFGSVTLTIVNMLGQGVKTIVSGGAYSGEHSLSWDGTNYNGKELPSGVYFAILGGSNMVETEKIILLK